MSFENVPNVTLPAPKPQGGMFGGSKFGLKQALAFGLAGLVSRQNPMLLQGLMGALMQRQKDAGDEQRHEIERQQELEDYGKKLQMQSQYAKPTTNDTVADFDFISKTLGPDAANRFLQTKTNPIVMTPYGPMPYSSVSGGGAPTAPVGRLTPLDEGGPTPSASGMFPRSY